MISKKNVLDLELRQSIYKFIQENPGLHQIVISRKMKIPKSTLVYHLRYLEKEELIISDSKEGLKRYYLSNKLGKLEKTILKFFREKTPRDILGMLASQMAISQIELSYELEKTPKTISYHLNKLIKADIIEPAPIQNGVVQLLKHQRMVLRSPVGREIIYRFKSVEVIRATYNTMIAHHNSFKNNEFPDGFIEDIKESMERNKRPPNKIIASKDQVDSVLEIIFEIFPHPYHA